MIDTTQPQTSLPVLITLAAATLTASLGISVASVLLPTLARGFSATVSEVQWVVLAYLVSVTITIVSAGRLGDLLGHRNVLIGGLFLFIATSVICALAPNLAVLVAARAMQGLGGAILIALPMSLARELVPAARLGMAMGLLGTTSAGGTALGPSLGGLLLTWGDWRMAFWLLAGFAAVTLVLSLTTLRKRAEKPPTTVKDLDLLGTVFLVIALASYALVTSGWAAGLSVSNAVVMGLGGGALLLFVVTEMRTSAPLVPMALLGDQTVGLGFVMNLIIGAIMMSTLVIGPFFLSFSFGLTDVNVGLILAVGPVVGALAGVPAGRLTDRYGATRMMVFAVAQIVFGLLCLAVLPRLLGVGGYVTALIFLTPAFQLFLAANNTAVLVDASPDQRGRLSGLLGLSRNLGLMTGASAMSTVFVFFLGIGNAELAGAEDVATAFSMTFLVTAGLAMLTLGLAIFGHIGRVSPAQTSPIETGQP